MKTGRSLQELAAELDRQSKSKRDFIAPTSLITVTQDHTLDIPGAGVFRPNQLFSNQMATYLGYPAGFYADTERNYPEQWRALVNEMLHRSDDNRMVRTMDGDARAFLSNRYRTLDNWDVTEAALSAIMDMNQWKVADSEITDSRLYIKAMSPKQLEVKKGDVVQSGVLITNSEVGLGMFKIEPLILRLVCTNGMIANQAGMKQRHLGRSQFGAEDNYELFSDDTKKLSDKALLAQIGDIVRNAVDDVKFGQLVSRMTEATQKPITGDVPKVVEIYAKEVKLSDTERSSVLRNLIEGADLSQYGLLNAVTATAQLSDSYDRSVELERVGGNLLDMPASIWNPIARAN